MTDWKPPKWLRDAAAGKPQLIRLLTPQQKEAEGEARAARRRAKPVTLANGVVLSREEIEAKSAAFRERTAKGSPSEVLLEPPSTPPREPSPEAPRHARAGHGD